MAGIMGQPALSREAKDPLLADFPTDAQAALVPSTDPFNLNQMQTGMCSASVKGTTESSISESELTVPSFWWVRDEISAQAQFGRRLIDRWLACPGQNNASSRVDFLVNQQVWSLLDYLERYQLIQRLGTVASSYQHDVRVFDRQGTLLGAYTCAFDTNVAISPKTKQEQDKSDPTAPLTCTLTLDSDGTAVDRGESNSDGFLPTPNGTVRP